MSANFVTRLFKLICVKIELHRAPRERAVDGEKYGRTYARQSPPGRTYAFFAPNNGFFPDTSDMKDEKLVAEYKIICEKLLLEQESRKPKT